MGTTHLSRPTGSDSTITVLLSMPGGRKIWKPARRAMRICLKALTALTSSTFHPRRKSHRQSSATGSSILESSRDRCGLILAGRLITARRHLPNGSVDVDLVDMATATVATKQATATL